VIPPTLIDPLDFVLEAPRVLLRRPRADDVDSIVDFYSENLEHFRPTDPERPAGFHTREWWGRRVGELEQSYREDRLLHTLVFRKDDLARVIGVVNFSNFVRGAFQACHLGYAIAEREQGRGLMREALEVAIEHTFGPMRMHRIMANHLPANVRSAVLLARLGFVAEGYARRYLRVGGRWQDFVLTSLVNDDWQPAPA